MVPVPPPDPYPIIPFRIPDFPARIIEQLGSKPKFWVRIPADAGQPSLGLFKLTRPDTGEAWAERVAYGLACELGLPCARYDLAVYTEAPPPLDSETRGVISWSFLESGESLVHGNEVLASIVTGYPVSTGGRFRRTPGHTVDVVLGQCDRVAYPIRWEPLPGLVTGADVMVGYLLLDAWIGNTDRHDENWGWVRAQSGELHLAPTFDHSSSLGRNETDENRQRRIVTTDPRFTVSAYAMRAPAALHRPADGRQLRTLEAFQRAAELRPNAARAWLNRLAGVSSEQVEIAVRRVPAPWISPVARTFAVGILTATRTSLLGLVE